MVDRTPAVHCSRDIAYANPIKYQNDPVFSKCELNYIPVFLGGAMKACGNTAPINIKSQCTSQVSFPIFRIDVFPLDR
jgi:hypothetical protein